MGSPGADDRRDLRGWLAAAHPWPLTMAVSLTLVIGLVSAQGGVAWERVVLLFLAIFGNQLAIGWSNDYRDRESDYRHQAGKPVPTGRVSAEGLAVGSILALSASLVCGLLLGLTALVLLISGSAAGLAYNFGLKNTRLSWLPYLVAFSLLPLFSWTALETFRTELLWLYPMALPLAVAAHAANSLPDLVADVGAGRHSLTVTLGRRNSLLLLAGSLTLPVILILIVLRASLLRFDPSLLGVGIGGYLTLICIAALSYGRRRDHLAFRLVSLAILVLVAGCLAAL